MELGSAARVQERLWARLRGPPLARRIEWRVARSAAWLRENLEAELAERAGLNWLAVAFGAGALIYFSLSREPPLSLLALATAISAPLAYAAYHRGAAWRALAVIAVLLAGATAAKLCVDRLTTPELERSAVTALAGRVIDRESRAERRPRIVLDSISAPTLSQPIPTRIRLSLIEKYGLPPLGSRVSLRARIAPIAGSVVPGGYDPHRAAFFEGIGGSGFVLGAWTLEREPADQSLDLLVAKIRAAIVQRIMAAQPGEAGAVAAALLVGERSELSAATNDSLRISGLFHVLSISGLHMMLVAGTTFLAVRALLALSPSLALRRPIRKWAALAALLVLTAYFALSGGGAATVRSYVMALIIFGAMLVDRPAISMRNLAIAAFIVLAMEPEGVVEPGFQMSFAAVAALIAGWEFWRSRRTPRLTDDDLFPGFRILRIIGLAIAGVAITTLIAGFATAPFAAYHFERVATYSLLGNLLGAPLISVIIMPFGLLSLVLMPFGLEAPPLAVMAWGIDMLLAVSRFVASLPGAQVRAPAIAPSCLLLVVAGLLWLCLWRRPWRLLGVPAIALGLMLVPLTIAPPDLLVAPDGRAVAVRDRSGILRISGTRAGSYAVQQFFDEEGGPPEDAALLREGVRCDRTACLLSGSEGSIVSHVLDPLGFFEDCAHSAIVVTPLIAPAECAAPLVIDAPKLARFGAHAIWIGRDAGGPTYKIATYRTETPRPWQAGELPAP